MYEKFLELPREKQLRIINSCMEVFSQNAYKRASTDEMAAKAGISKGSLFYYFHNKKALYLFLFQYTEEHLRERIVNEEFLCIEDFFELMLYAAEKKAEILAETPYLMDFAMNAFYSQKEEVSEALDHRIGSAIDETFAVYFQKIDFGKFKEGISPREIMDMLIWLGDGYLYEKRRAKEPIDMPTLTAVFRRWCAMLRSISYKEEFLNGSDPC